MNEIQLAGILWYNTGIRDVIGVGITDVIRDKRLYQGRDSIRYPGFCGHPHAHRTTEAP